MAAAIANGSSESVALPSALGRLSDEVESKLHLLASDGDDALSSAALQSAKQIFELGLSQESISHAHLHPFLAQILEPPTVALRSKTRKIKGKAPSPSPVPKIDPSEILPYTPLTELTVDGLDVDQIWAQLELRSEGIIKICKELGPGDGVDMDKLDESDVGLESDDEDDDSEEMTEEEWKQMLLDNGVDEGMDSDEDDDEDDEDDAEEEGDSNDEENMIKWKDEMSGSEDDDEGSEELDELEDQDEEESDGDDEEDYHMVDDDDAEEEDEEDEEGDEADSELDEDEEAGDDRNALFGDEPGPSRRPRHPTLDDDFFSIDDFNRLTEEAEAGRLTSGRLGGGGDDDEDEDDLGDAGALMLQAAPDEDQEIMYKDFFAQPRGMKFKANGKGKGKGKEPAKKDKVKGKVKGVSFDEDEDDEDGGEEEEGGRDIMGRFKGDLFDSDDEAAGEAKNLSTYEKQQQALAAQIAELEQEAVGPKDWTLLGEATSRARPENSLLEEDLDFEQMGKVVPVVTEEKVQSLEEMIKKRIIDNNFDSTKRVRAYEPTPYLPSRYFELQDTQSAKSLAQIYEEEYQAAATGQSVKDPRDEKLRKQHEEIDQLWNDICYKLDALSSLNFVPKQPKAQITTMENLPTASMESALPPTSTTTSLLAPEEMFAPPSATALIARSELNPEQAQAARLKRKREKKADRKRLGEMAELYGKRKGAKAEKEQAMKDLVKTGKGVTVVGKGKKELGKAAKRAANGEENRKDSKRLKL